MSSCTVSQKAAGFQAQASDWTTLASCAGCCVQTCPSLPTVPIHKCSVSSLQFSLGSNISVMNIIAGTRLRRLVLFRCGLALWEFASRLLITEPLQHTYLALVLFFADHSPCTGVRSLRSYSLPHHGASQSKQLALGEQGCLRMGSRVPAEQSYADGGKEG